MARLSSKKSIFSLGSKYNKLINNRMNEKMIERLNKEADEKAIYCQLCDYLFDADLMAGFHGQLWRANISLEQLY